MDLNGLAELDYIRRRGRRAAALAAMTRQRRLERDPLVARRAPLLHEAMPLGGPPSNSQPRHAGRQPGARRPGRRAAGGGAGAGGAGCARSRLAGERWIAAADFFQGLFTTALSPDEMLVEIALPPLPARTGTAFLEFARRRGDYALMGVAAVVTLDEAGRCQRARLVYLNAGEGPVVAPQSRPRTGRPGSHGRTAPARPAWRPKRKSHPLATYMLPPPISATWRRCLTRQRSGAAVERAGRRRPADAQG